MNLEAARAWVLAHGTCSLSAQALRPGYTFWCDGVALVPFVATPCAWVTAGPPVTAAALGLEGQAQAARRFARLAAQAGGRAIFFGIAADLAQAAGLAAAAVGLEPLWEPRLWFGPARRASVGAQLRRAARAGVRITALPSGAAPSAQVQGQMAALVGPWRARQAMPAMAFVVALHLDTHGHHAWVLAQVGERVVGFAKTLRYGPQGQFLLEHIVRAADAPNGTAEALVDGAMGTAAAGAELSLGLLPLAGPIGPSLRLVRRCGAPFYSFAGLAAFKRKLGPQAERLWHVAWAPPAGLGQPLQRQWAAACAFVALARAFAGVSLMLFAARLVLRGPRPLLLLLTVLLPLWTWGLACLDTATWFPSPWVQQAWLAFDIALSVALAYGLWRPSSSLYGALAAVVAVDSVVTAMEALLYPGPLHLFGLGMHGAGVAAPGLSAVLLYGAWRRLQQAQKLPNSRP